MTITDTTSSYLQALRARLGGSVFAPSDEGFDEARQAWNLAADLRPALVAFPESRSDVAALVSFARTTGLRVNVQGTGHNPMPLGDMRDTLLIRTNRMNRVSIDAEGRSARVEAGAIWRDVMIPASERGLAALAGSSPDVGVVGYSLGGGVGYLGRRHGLAANALTSIELVTADGEHVRADREHEAELFWALRGGGGNFGVVTAMEFDLFPVESLYAGWLAWPWEHGVEVLNRWRELLPGLPEELTSMARLMQLPPIPQLPEFLRGRNLVVISAAHLGDQAEGERLLAPLRELKPEIDTFAPIPPAALVQVHGDPEEPVPGISDHTMLDELPEAAIDAMVEQVGPGSGSPLLMMELRHLGGALAREPEGHGALARMGGEFLAFAAGLPMGPESAMEIERYAHEAMFALAPYGSGRGYSNFAERKTNTRSFFPVETHQRLQQLKAQIDPENLFRANHEIPRPRKVRGVSGSEALGDRHTVEVPAGTIAYRERGSGPAVVFVHGVGVNGDLWRKLVPELAGEYRCVAPDLPYGAHSLPLREDADLSLPGMARIVADFVEALGLEDVAVVANDTGGAVAQWLVGHHAERVGRLVLTSCDAFEKFPPRPQLYLKPASRVPPLWWFVGWSVQFKFVQRLPTAYGWTTWTAIDADVMRSFTDPIRTIPGVRRDLRRLLLAVDTRYTFEAAESLRGFDKPALVVWAADDKLFPLEHGRRLAELLPQGRFETIADSRTFIPEEQPERLAETIRPLLGGA